MAAATVLYVLNLSGDISSKLPSLSKGLQELGAKAAAAKASLSTMGSNARSAFNTAADGAKNASEGALKAAAGFAALGFATHKVLGQNEEYKQSTARLAAELQKMGASIANELGPKAATFIDSFSIGLVYLSRLIIGGVSAAFSTLLRIIDRVMERLGRLTEIFQRLASGDLQGAFNLYAQSIADFPEALSGALGEIKQGFDEFGEAQADAMAAAKKTWQAQVDGISDTKAETEKLSDEMKLYIAQIETLYGFGSSKPAAQLFQPALTKKQQNAFGGETAIDSPRALTIEAEPAKPEKTQAEIAAGIQDANRYLSGIQGGVLGLLAAGGPWGAMIAAILSLAENLGDIVKSTNDQIIGIITNLDDQFARVLGGLTERVVEAIPEMAASLLALIPELILQLIASGPRIFVALVEAIMDMPAAIGREFADMWREFVDDLLEGFRKMTRLFGGGARENPELAGAVRAQQAAATGNVMGANPAFQEFARQQTDAARGRQSLDKFESGGMVMRTEPILAHRGELVTPAHQVRQMGRQQPSVSNITINVNGVRNVDDLARQIRSRLGPYGVGLSLEPHRGG